ncbi:RiPP maturation radical SAM C-methyltransferase [Streptomyces sp. SID14478]|uniref:RiPP maturation radical SAM C-methyltransferase n=1 Tax=Streptomyces sp. SID14478 TaxID=2706073 RepID=UPI001EF1B779|nr:RiPP maturation radical SAM C-methyltransferase [Streptomyces sp. SID14478]
MRVQLVTMPWHPIDLPSLQVGLLHQLLRQVRPDDEVREFHGSLRWAEFLLERSGGRLRPGDYEAIGSDSIFHGLGDWVFSGVLYGDESWGVARLHAYARARALCADTLTTVSEMRALAAEYIDRCADEVLGHDPDVVGFTSTFMQNVSSLALARELKRRRPQLTVVFGGSNCEGPMGHALHRNHPYVDHVVRGEGEYAFPALLAHLDAGTPPDDVPGLCWWETSDGGRRSSRVSRANTETRRTVAPADIPSPDYDQWHAEIEASPVIEYVYPKLVVEGARGCWWGEKHHCTFCGLNGTAMAFRAKPGERLWSEIDRLVRRHHILDIVTVDNIIDMAYFKDFLPRAAESGWDLRMHYEVKSNLSREQIALLGEAGAVLLQPGIESLSNRVLDLMDKGVSGARNVRTLREFDNHAITCTWNYLYGFPGETADDYARVLDQTPALVHLQPPGGAHRIQLERFSPHFTNPALGFGKRHPAEMYQHVYELPEDELADLVYLFDTEDAGIGGEIEDRLLRAVVQWRAAHAASTLVMTETGEDGEALLVRDRRQGWPPRTYWFNGWQAAALSHLEEGRTAPALHRHLTEGRHRVSQEELGEWLTEALALGLLFRDDRTYVSLPTRSAPIRVDRASPEATDLLPECDTPAAADLLPECDPPDAVAPVQDCDTPDAVAPVQECGTPAGIGPAREAVGG